jgi:hypothetical protein
LERCVAEAALQKDMADIEITKLGAKLERSETNRKALVYLDECANEDMKKAEREGNVALKKAQTAEK